MKRARMKLQLNRETIAALDTATLARVAGGDPEKAGTQDSLDCWVTWSCPSCLC